MMHLFIFALDNREFLCWSRHPSILLPLPQATSQPQMDKVMGQGVTPTWEKRKEGVSSRRDSGIAIDHDITRQSFGFNSFVFLILLVFDVDLSYIFLCIDIAKFYS